MPPKMLRGHSFVAEYGSKRKLAAAAAAAATAAAADPEPAVAAVCSADAGLGSGCDDSAVLSLLKRRAPTMLRSGSRLIASPESAEAKRYTVVLDLDETVVYARNGPLYARDHLQDLLRALDVHCEVVVWTAGERHYAKAILEEINVDGIIKHCVTRHRSWFAPSDYTKDLKRLGRNLDYVLIVENTPDCVRVNPTNGIIVEDFEVSEAPPAAAAATAAAATSAARPRRKKDHTFEKLMRLVRELGESGDTVPVFLARCELLRRQSVMGSNGKRIPIFYLPSGVVRRRRNNNNNNAEEAAAAGDDNGGGDGDVKVVKANRDKRPRVAAEQGGDAAAEGARPPQRPRKA